MANKTNYGITRIKDPNTSTWKPLKGVWHKTATGWKPVQTVWTKVGPDSWERVYPTPGASIKPTVTSLSFTTYQNHYYNDNTNGQTVTITNSGDQTLQLTDITAIDPAGYISTIKPINITLPANISANSSASISFNVYGKLVGNTAGSLTFRGNGGVLGTISTTIPVYVSVLPEFKKATVTPSSVSYAITDGDPLPSATLTVKNDGNGASLTISSIASKYGFTSIGTYTAVLASGTSTAVTLTAYREPAGVYSDVIVVKTTDPVTPVIEIPVSLIVSAKRPVIAVNPDALSFSVANLSTEDATPQNSTTQIVMDLSDPSKYTLGTNANVAPYYYFSRTWIRSNYKTRVLQPPIVDNMEVTSIYNKVFDLDTASSYVKGSNTQVDTYTNFVYNSRQLNAPTISSNIAVFGFGVSANGVEERTLTSSTKLDLTHVNSLVYEINMASYHWWGDRPERGENLKLQYSLDGTTWVDLYQHEYVGAWAHRFYNYYYYWYGLYNWYRYYRLDWFYRYGYWYYGNGWAQVIAEVPDAARVAGGAYLRYYQRRTGRVDPPKDTWAMTSVSTNAIQVGVFGFAGAATKETRTITSNNKVILQDVDKLVFQVNKGTSAGWGDIPETNESIILQYSIDGNTWADIKVIAPADVAADKWTAFNVPVPGPAKSTTGVYLRYYQQRAGSKNYRDTWAMSSVGASTWIAPTPSANVSITNVGGGTLQVISVASESNLTVFAEVPATVDAGTPRTFIATSTGIKTSKTDRIVITSNSVTNPVTYLPITYNAIVRYPTMVVTPAAITFGERNESETSRQLAKIAVTNTSSGANSAPLSIVGVRSAQGRARVSNIPVSIDPGTTQEFDVDIPDWDKYEVFDTIIVESNDPVNPVASVPLTYAYTSKITGVIINPSTQTNTNTKQGQYPADVKFTVLNASGATANLYVGAGNIISKSGNITFTGVPEWLNPGISATVTAKFNNYANLPAQLLKDEIYFRTNDTYTPNIAVPVITNITGLMANVRMDPTTLSFTTELNDDGSSSNLTANVKIYNDGERNLTVSSIATEVGYGYIIAPSLPMTVAPGAYNEFQLKTVSNAQPGINQDRVVVTSDADNGSIYKIPYDINITVTHGTATFTTAGAFTWTAPHWINQANVTVIGGGGGGGAAQSNKSKTGSGAGGGTGGISTMTLSSVPAGTVFIGEVGAGGLGGLAKASDGSYFPGSNGKASYLSNPTWGNVVAAGGGGGGVGTLTTAGIGGTAGPGGVNGTNGLPFGGNGPAPLGQPGGKLPNNKTVGSGGIGATPSIRPIPYAVAGGNGYAGIVTIVW